MLSTPPWGDDLLSEAPRSRSEGPIPDAFYFPSSFFLALAIPFSGVRLCFGAPAFARAERSDVGDVVAAVPGVEGERFVERHHATLRMAELARPIGGGKRAEKRDPAAVERFEQGERSLDRRRFGIGKLGPTRFIIGLDGRLVFRQREFEADVGVQVAVRQGMNQLADGPAAWAVGRIELLGREALYRGAKMRGRLIDLIDHIAALFFGRGIVPVKSAGGIAQVLLGHRYYLRIILRGGPDVLRARPSEWLRACLRSRAWGRRKSLRARSPICAGR